MIYRVFIFLIIAFGLFLLNTFLIFESFSNKNFKYKSPTKCNDNIFNHTIIITNNDTNGEKIMKLLQNDNTMNVIKYLDGVKWNDWNHNVNEKTKKGNDEVIRKISKILETDDYEIVYSKINKYRQSLDCSSKIIIDCDILVHKEPLSHAYHFKVLYLEDTVKQYNEIVFIKMIGKVEERYIYEDDIENNEIIDMQIYKNENISKDIFDTNDTIQDIITQDQKVANLLYNKFMIDHVKSDDYKKNIVFKKNHDFILNMFMNKLKTKECKSFSRYQYI
jgi:hypothetical protein